MRRATEQRRRRAGFTLIEMVVVIAITGIIVAAMSVFGRRQIDAYVDVSSRAALVDEADLALRRIGRELQAALPNSVRVNASNSVLEFVPISAAGRYRADLTPAGTGNALDLSNALGKTFDVLGPAVTTVTGDQLVIYNLGQTGADVYDGSSKRALTTIGAALSSLTFSGAQFPFGSPQHRFQIVNGPVAYECSGGVMRRHSGYGFSATMPTSFAAGDPILVDHVANCVINYTAGALARNGLVSIRLSLQADNGETVDLMHEVEVLNAP